MAAPTAVFSRPRPNSSPKSPHARSPFDPQKVDLSKCVNPDAMQAFFSASAPRSSRRADGATTPLASPRRSGSRARSVSSDSTVSSVRSVLIADLNSMWMADQQRSSASKAENRNRLRHSYPGAATPSSVSPTRPSRQWRSPPRDLSSLSPSNTARRGHQKHPDDFGHEGGEMEPPLRQSYPFPTRTSLLREEEHRFGQQHDYQQNQRHAHSTRHGMGHDTSIDSRGYQPSHSDGLERGGRGTSHRRNQSAQGLPSHSSRPSVAALDRSDASPPRWRHNDQHMAMRSRSPPSRFMDQNSHHHRPPPPQGRGGAPEVFLEMLKQIEERLEDLPRAIRIRVERWVAKLAYQVDHPTWIKERNLYCAALLHAVTTNNYSDPFHASPPEGNLPSVPAWIRRAYSRKGVGARGAPMPSANKSTRAKPPFWEPPTENLGTSLSAPAPSHDPHNERYDDEAVRFARRIAAGHYHRHRHHGGGGTLSPGAHATSPERMEENPANHTRDRSGSGESTLTLTLRHNTTSGGNRRSAGPLLPPSSTLSKPQARKALLAHGPAPGDLNDALLELGGEQSNGAENGKKQLQQQQQRGGGASGEGGEDGSVGESLAVAEAKQRFLEAESREKAARTEVAALRRKLTEANARAEGLASAAGAAASRHEEILSKMADAHKAEIRQLQREHGEELDALQHLYAMQAARRVDTAASIRDPALKPQPAQLPPDTAKSAGSSTDTSFRFGGGGHASVLHRSPTEAASTNGSAPPASAAAAPSVSPVAAAAPRSSVAASGDVKAAAHDNDDDDDTFLASLDDFEATAAAALSFTARGATPISSAAQSTTAASVVAPVGGYAHQRR